MSLGGSLVEPDPLPREKVVWLQETRWVVVTDMLFQGCIFVFLAHLIMVNVLGC